MAKTTGSCERCRIMPGKDHEYFDPEQQRHRKAKICNGCLVAWGKEWAAKMAARLDRR